MFQIEIDLRAGQEAERFNTAVYRFLELHAEGVDGMELVKIETHPDGPVEHKRVTAAASTSANVAANYAADAAVSGNVTDAKVGADAAAAAGKDAEKAGDAAKKAGDKAKDAY